MVTGGDRVVLFATVTAGHLLRLTAEWPNRARRSSAFCFVGTPSQDSALRVRSRRSPESCPVPPTKHFDSPLRSWERFRLLLGAPAETGAKGETTCTSTT